MANPIVTFTMENGDVMKAELYPEIAPTSVNNFVNLVQKGFYDGLIFHRVIAGFMIQGGDPEGTGMGGPGYSIKGEFASNGFKNDLKHTRGVLSMARSMRPDSAGSQFFIMHQNAPHLDGDYAAFGKLIEGEGILDKIDSSRIPFYNYVIYVYYFPIASISAFADSSVSLISAPPKVDSTTPTSTSSICGHVFTIGLA